MPQVSSGLNAHDRVLVQTGLTADAGSAQAGATALIEGVNIVDTVATIADSLLLPSAVGVGQMCRIFNQGANAADVFPSSGEDAGAGANTAVSLASGANVTYMSTGVGAWEALS